MDTKNLLFLILLTITINCSQSANILFFYGGGTYSHKLAIWSLPSSLADRGHQITFISPHDKRPWTHPNITDIVPTHLEKLLSVFHLQDKLEQRLAGEELRVWDTLEEWSINICKTLLHDDFDSFIKDLVHKKRFDLIFVNAAFGECAYVMNQVWGAKVILMDSTSILPYFPDMLGMSLESSWIPDISSQFWYRMGYVERLSNYFYTLRFHFKRRMNLYPVLEELMRELLKQERVPSFADLERETTDMVFLNTHPTTDFARALPPNFVHIGGLQLWEPRVEKIPEKLQKFMDGAENGVILMGLGTSYDISHTNSRFRDIFWETVRAFPKIRFIFTWEGEHPKDLPKNLLLSGFLPQKEVLGHPKMKAIISHCGLYSIAEATFHGVPIIGIPLVADEDYNLYRIQMEEIGVGLEVKTLTTNGLKGALKEILTNKKYQKNMKRMSKFTRERPMNPIDVGVWWTEFVLRNDDFKTFRPRTEHLSWIELRSLDVHATLFILILLVIISLIKVVKTVSTKCITPTSRNNNNSGKKVQ